MPSRRSPFRPSFGVTPPLVAGREAIVSEISDALQAGPGAAARASLFTGNRGIGKTVMLNEVEDEARQQGWVVVSETATQGVVERMMQEALPDLARLLRQEPTDRRRRIAGVTLPVGLGGMSFDLPPPQESAGLRSQINVITDLLAKHGTGLLITIDEVHSTQARDDVGQICAVVQHAFREQQPLAFAAAGLPAAVQDLLSDDVSTFLRRARRFVLQPLTAVAAEEALRVPIEQAGRSISDQDLRGMASASFGYPYLLQAIGDHVWRQAPDSTVITGDHVAQGVDSALREVGFALHEPALNDLSGKDREFVLAMVADRGPSKISDIQQRLGQSHGWTSRYRSRLIVAGIVEPAGHGRLRFTVPYLREFLEEHGDTYR